MNIEISPTLREEFRRFMVQEAVGGEIWLVPSIERISDWWLNKFNQKLEEIEREIEEERKKGEDFEKDINAIGLNNGLDLALQIIKNKKN